ncbi:hypothetical protein ACWDOP_33180 [Nocardia sp. NPDC003693]
MTLRTKRLHWNSFGVRGKGLAIAALILERFLVAEHLLSGTAPDPNS